LPVSAHPTPSPALEAAQRLAAEGAPARRIGGRAFRRRAGFQYWLIFSVCLFVLLWAGIIERLNPLYWFGRKPGRYVQPLWTTSRETAHRCTSLAFEG
jgi:hypothetical protein